MPHSAPLNLPEGSQQHYAAREYPPSPLFREWGSDSVLLISVKQHNQQAARDRRGGPPEVVENRRCYFLTLSIRACSCFSPSLPTKMVAP